MFKNIDKNLVVYTRKWQQWLGDRFMSSFYLLFCVFQEFTSIHKRLKNSHNLLNLPVSTVFHNATCPSFKDGLTCDL